MLKFLLSAFLLILLTPINVQADTFDCKCCASGTQKTNFPVDTCSNCDSACKSVDPSYTNCGCTSTGSGGGGNSGAPVTLDDPLGLGADAQGSQKLIGRVIGAALGIVGSLALAMFIFGGFLWMTAMGNADKVKKGRDTMIWAALGLVIIFTAYALITFVLTNVLGAK